MTQTTSRGAASMRSVAALRDTQTRWPVLHFAWSIALACGAPNLSATEANATHTNVEKRAVVEETLAADEWPALTRRDIAAVDQWLRDGYPGLVDPDQAGFADIWQRARQLAELRSAQVRDYAGWRATLFALVNAARDGHLLLLETKRSETLRWAGLALEYRAPDFLARIPQLDHPAIERRLPDGARLLNCDGIASADLLRDRLDGHVANWQLEADRALYAAQLFVDRGNPFASAPRQCRFSDGSREYALTLNWHAVAATELQSALAPFRRLRAQRDRLTLQFDPDGSAWITVGNLADYNGHQRLQQQLQQQQLAIRQAPYVVFDLRGNSGGDSQLGTALVSAIWGADAVPASPPAAQPKRWRVSNLVHDTVRTVRDAVAASANPNPHLIQMADRLLPHLQAALNQNQTLLAVDERSQSATAVTRQSPVRQTVFALTDGGCFSSCIIMHYMLQRLGAIAVGDPTGRHTVYGEAWFNRQLPSGHATLVLPLAINAYPAGELGGDAPRFHWQGASEDEPGLRKWLAAIARENAHTTARNDQHKLSQ